MRSDGNATEQFRLVVNLASRVIQAGQTYLNSALRERGLSSAEANILMFLYTNGDGIRQEDIVAGVEISKPAVSRTVTSLVKKGYVKRVPGKRDRRSRIVLLTAKARDEQAFIEKQYRDLVDAASRGVPEDKVTEFIDVFKKVAENLETYRKNAATSE